MEDTYKTDCLSFGDSLFLHLEREGMPLHVASVCIFEGQISLEECTEQIGAKLHLVPRYLQRVIPPPFGLGVLRWENDPSFDIRNHVREFALKRGTDSELQKIAAQILSNTLDRHRPLWDFALITGLRGNRTAMLARVHHCLADGISGVELLSKLLDVDPTARAKARKQPRTQTAPARDQATQLLEGLGITWFAALERLLTAESQLLKLAQHFAASTPSLNSFGLEEDSGNQIPSMSSSGLGPLLAEFGSPPDRLPFNIVCRGPQRFFWSELPFPEIRALKKRLGVTVNDVVLTLVASTIRQYARSRNVSTAGRILRIVVPVSVRGPSQANGLGNEITFVPVTIPLGIRNPRELLEAVHQRMELLKRIRVAEMVGLAGTLLGAIPAPFQAFAGPIVSQLPLNVCNLICTNVPGPPHPLYMAGHKMLTFYPYVPIGGEMGMNCAVLTYNGTAFFGFTGDVHAIPDLKRLPEFLQDSFDELKKSTGMRFTTEAKKIAKRKPAQKTEAPAEIRKPPASTDVNTTGELPATAAMKMSA